MVGITGGEPPIQVLFSAAWPGVIEVDELPGTGIEVRLVRRTVDWNMTGFRRLLTYVLDSLRIVWWGRAYDVTVVSSAGAEALFVALLWPLVRRKVGARRDLVILDPFPLRWRRLDHLYGLAMRSVTTVICIRRGDIDTFARRFAVPASKCRFVPMPVPVLPNEEAGTPSPGTPDHYAYAAGSSHRHWPVLLRAFEMMPGYRCVLATESVDPSVTTIPPNVKLLPQQSVEEGRKLMRRAAIVAVAFEDTDLACGPTIVLDAYAMGLPVACTDTNACRDYVQDGVTGYLSPPDDAAALARNLRLLLDDADRRQAMRNSIEALAQGELSRSTFLDRISALLTELRSP